MKLRLALGGALLLAACEIPEPDRDLRLKYEADAAAESAKAAHPQADTLAPDSAGRTRTTGPFARDRG